MPRPPRFYLPTLHEGEVTLDGSEAHHLLNVRRLGVGAEVELFNGAGKSCFATVQSATRRDVILETQTLTQQTVSNSTLTLAIGFPKPDRARWMVEKLTELGVGNVVPLETEFSRSSGKPINVAKLSQYIVDACKQSGRNHLMTIAEPTTVGDVLSGSAATFFLADADGVQISNDKPTSEAIAFVGPEAGFSTSERQEILDAGAKQVAFAKDILRVETAAISAAILLRQPG